jgi:hypothetical protein
VAELNEDYIARMEDIWATSERPDDPHAPVGCLAEKPVTLPADLRPLRTAVPGRAARGDHEYRGGGAANVCGAVEPQAGRHFTCPTPDRSGGQFAQVRFELARQYPSARTIHLMVDNLNIHRGKSLTDRDGSETGRKLWQRFTVHYTPTHGSWLNQAEIAIGLFARQCLGHRRIPDLRTLRREARAWNRRINRARTRINWRFDRRAARRKFGYTKHFSKRSKT